MKTPVLLLISVYQAIISPMIKHVLGVRTQCRFSPTCSTYAKQVIQEQGVIKGTQLSVKRLLSCQPFSKSYGHI